MAPPRVYNTRLRARLDRAGRARAAPPTQTTSFADLPRELRDMVYGAALGPTVTLTLTLPPRPGQTPSTLLSLLCSGRQIGRETIEALCIFCEVNFSSIQSLANFVVDRSRARSELPRALRNVTITMHDRDVNQIEFPDRAPPAPLLPSPFRQGPRSRLFIRHLRSLRIRYLRLIYIPGLRSDTQVFRIGCNTLVRGYRIGMAPGARITLWEYDTWDDDLTFVTEWGGTR